MPLPPLSVREAIQDVCPFIMGFTVPLTRGLVLLNSGMPCASSKSPFEDHWRTYGSSCVPISNPHLRTNELMCASKLRFCAPY